MSLQDYIIEKPVIETERLILRKLAIKDVNDLREWLAMHRYMIIGESVRLKVT